MNVLLFIVLFIFVLLLYKRRTILPFSFLFTVFWFINIVFAEIFFKDYKFSISLYIFLIFACLSVFLGEFLGMGRNNKLRPIEFSENRLFLFTYISVAIGFVFPIESLILNGVSIDTLLSFENLLAANNKMAVARYSDELETSLLSQITLIFLYLAPLLAGFITVRFKSKKLIFITILPSFLVLITQNTKLVFIAALFLIIVGRLTYFLIFFNRFPSIKLNQILKLFFGGFIFYILMLFTFVARVGKINDEVFNTANSKIASYVAHLPAFDNWLNDYLFNDDHYIEWGLKTFYGVTNFIGLVERKTGVFENYYVFTSNNIEFKTNVYTVFRFHIEDFGIFGTFLFLFFLSFIYRKIKLLSNKFPLLLIAITANLLFYIFNSFLTSLWAYMSFILVFVFFYFFLLLARKDIYV